MKTLVVDASVVAAAFLPEAYHDVAKSLLASGRNLAAPDLLVAEVGNVLWKRAARGELTPAEAEALLADVLRLPIEYTSATVLTAEALTLALRTGRTVYDCLYLALAVRHGTTLFTGDQRLVNALVSTPMARHTAWIGKLPSGMTLDKG